MNIPLTIDTIALRDVCRMELLHPLTRLGYNLQTTTFTYNLLNGGLRREIDFAVSAEMLHIMTITDNELTPMLKIQEQNPTLTLADAALLFQCQRDRCYLYTVDSNLRKTATIMDITVLDHSMILGKMVVQHLLDITLATEKYYEVTRWINRYCDTAPPVNNFPSIELMEEAC